MTDQMPQVNAEFGTTPVIEFPTPEAPKGLKVVELTEGDGPIVRRGDTVTVNYHGVVWGKDTPFDSSFDRHQPASFGIGVGQVIKGWDQTVPGHNVGSRLVVSIPPEYGYGSRGIPQAGIGGEEGALFAADLLRMYLHRRRGHAGVRHRHHFHPLTIGQHMTNAGVIAGVLS